MKDLNPTTMTYPREMGHAKPEQHTIYGPYKHEPKHSGAADFWVAITLAFAAGFLVSHLWG